MATNEEVWKREQEEQRRKEDEDRMLAEQEFMQKHQEQRKLSRETGGALSMPSRTTSMSSLGESDGEADKRKRGREKEKSPGGSKKKRTEGDESDDEEEFGQDPLRNLNLGLDLLVAWSRQQTIQKMVTRPQHKKLEKIIMKMREEVIRGREERSKLETSVVERSSLVDVVRETVREELGRREVQPGGVASYAAALGRTDVPKVPKISGVKGPVQPAPKLVIVRHEEKESEEVVSTLKRLVKPSDIGIKVKRLFKIRKGVMVEVESERCVESLIGNKELSDAGLKVDKPVKKKPVIMVYDVSAELEDDEVRQEVFHKNFQDSELTEEEFNREFEPRHKYKDARSGGKKCHIVVECSVRVRNWLRGRERVYIEWQSCRVKDYVDVARCYKCQRFGHVAKHCNDAKSGCSYCAGEHEYKVCPNKKDKEKVCCANCKREGRTEDKHDAGWRWCPAYEKAVKRQNEKIDYGL